MSYMISYTISDSMGKTASMGKELTSKLTSKLTSNLPSMRPIDPTVFDTLRSLPTAAAVAAGGAREEPLSTEAQIMGATVIALIAGGSLKGLVDYLMKE